MSITIIVPHRGAPIIRQWRTADSSEEPRNAGVLFRAGDPKGEHRYLLLRRAATSDHPGTWAFPGGEIEPNETSLMAAIREVSEEIGINIRPWAHKLQSLGVVNHFETWLFNIGGEFVPMLNREHTDYRWAKHSALPSPMHLGAQAVLARLHHPY